jgi:hypothetical protein
MLDYAPVAAVMQHCREHGIPFALDDFGTGYSNLTHLHKLDFEFVKVDQAFARHMFDPRARWPSCRRSWRWRTASAPTWWWRAWRRTNSCSNCRRWACATRRAT